MKNKEKESIFKYGEIVLVKNAEYYDWVERIFIRELPNNLFPFLCVKGNLDDGNILSFKKGYTFLSSQWRFCVKKFE